MSTEAKKYVPLWKFAQLNGLSISTLKKMVQENTFPHIRLGGGEVRLGRIYVPSDALELLRAQQEHQRNKNG